MMWLYCNSCEHTCLPFSKGSRDFEEREVTALAQCAVISLRFYLTMPNFPGYIHQYRQIILHSKSADERLWEATYTIQP